MNTVIWKGRRIPAQLAQISAGKDKGARQLKVKCCECGAEFKLCDSDSSEHCQPCYDLAGLENQISDTPDDAPEMPALLAELHEARRIQHLEKLL